MSSGDFVWIIEDSVVGEVLSYGAQFSLVKWYSNGIIYQEYLENFEFIEYNLIDE